MIYEDMTQEDVDSILNGDFSCETTEDLYEPTDDELLYPSKHYDWVSEPSESFKDKHNAVHIDNGVIFYYP